jgi:hypothetical protein
MTGKVVARKRFYHTNYGKKKKWNFWYCYYL